jgi:maleate cis-trans isomerase
MGSTIELRGSRDPAVEFAAKHGWTQYAVDAICIPCTDFPRIRAIEKLKARYGYLVYDTIETVVWKSMLIVRADPAKVSDGVRSSICP